MTDPSFLLSKVNNLGDAVAFLPTVAGLRKAFPRSRIDLVCSPKTAGIFSASVENIRTVSVSYQAVRGARGLLAVPGVVAELGIGRHDFALLSHDETKFAHAVTLAVMARRRIGFDLVNPGWGRLLTDRLPFVPGRNIVDLNFDLVRRVTGQPGLSPSRTPLGYDPGDIDIVETKLRAVGIKPEGPFVVVQPFASLPYKRWDLDRYLAVVDRIASRLGIPALIVAESNAADLGDRLFVSDLSIPQLAALLERASLFLGNNSGPMHIASAMGTPTLVVHGPSAFEWDAPWTEIPHRRLVVDGLGCIPCERIGGLIGRCTNPDYPGGCMAGISVDTVFGHVEEMLRLGRRGFAA
jgi:ADP-heptose:LPS heptosyltransferase